MTKDEYINSRYDNYLHYWARIGLGFGPIAVISLIPLDYLASPENFRLFLLFRSCTAALLLCLYVINKKFPGRKLINSSILLAAVAVSAMLALMIARFGGHQSPYAAGFILLGIFVSGVVPLSFAACLISSLTAYTIYLIPILLYDPITNMPHFASASVLIFASMSTMLILRYFANKRLFHEFELQFEVEQYKTSLEDQVKDRTYQLSTTIMHLEQEVREREQAEKKLIESKNDWEDTFNSINDAITIHDKDFTITRINTAAERLLGMRAAEIVGIKCFKSYHGTDKAPEGCPSCLTLQNGTPSVTELFEPHLNKYIEIKALPRINRAGALIGVIHIVRDITEEKRLKEQLIQAQKIEAIGQLAGGVAHDFNNILTAIVGYAHLTLMKMAQDEPLRIYLEQILQASDKATVLTQSLLAFSRKQILNPKHVNLSEIVKRLEKLLKRLIREDIHIETNYAAEALIVFADAGQIEQVLMNLVTNARDALPKGGKIVIETGAMQMGSEFIDAHGYGQIGRYALLSVSDNGEGMDANTREKIFEPFFTTKEQGKGTGLGLAMVYGIIKQHEGFINVHSEPGKGTAFKIYLPLSAGSIETKEEQEVSVVTKGGTETILLAEDDSTLRTLMSTVLRNQGYRVIEAIDGADAIQHYGSNRDIIQLVVLDGIMPKKNGKEALDEIRLINPEVKALFVSGYPEDIISKQGILESGIHFSLKPLSPSALLKKVRELLDAED